MPARCSLCYNSPKHQEKKANGYIACTSAAKLTIQQIFRVSWISFVWCPTSCPTKAKIVKLEKFVLPRSSMKYDGKSTMFRWRPRWFCINGGWKEVHWKNYHWLFWPRIVKLEAPSGCLISSKRRDFTLDQRWLDNAGPFAFITWCFRTLVRARVCTCTEESAERVMYSIYACCHK